MINTQKIFLLICHERGNVAIPLLSNINPNIYPFQWHRLVSSYISLKSYLLIPRYCMLMVFIFRVLNQSRDKR